MAKAMTLINSQVLGSAQASVTFSSIPGTYRDLRLVVVTDLASTANIQPRVNGDSGNNYTNVGMGFNWQPALYGASNFSINAFSDTRGYPVGGYAGGNMQIWEFLDYSATDKHKTVLMKAQGQPTSAANGGMDVTVQRWASTSAITSIVLSLTTGSFSTGGTFYLYGIAG